MSSIEEITNNILHSIQEFDSEEASYWCRLFIQKLPAHGNASNSIPLDSLFFGFELCDADLSILLSKLIWEIVKDEDFPVILTKYRHQLLMGLNSAQEPVNQLSLDIIFKLALLTEAGSFPLDDEIVSSIVNLLNSSNYSVSASLVKYFEELPPQSLDQFIEPLLQLYSKVSSLDPVAQFRFLELFSKLGSSGLSDKASQLRFTFTEETKQFLKKDSDPLLLANCLQTIQDSIQNSSQVELLQSQGLMDAILTFLPSVSSPDRLENTIACSKVLDILANCVLNGSINANFINEKQIDAAIVRSFDSSDEGVKSSAAFCAASAATLGFENLLPHLENSYFNGVSSVQFAALHGLGIYFMSSQVDEQTKSSLISRLNCRAELRFFDLLQERAASHFEEQKVAAYFALKGALGFPAGLRYALDHSAILVTILDRESDASQMGLKWKYGILEQIAKSPILFGILNSPLQEQIRTYLGQGVVFISKRTHVSFETAN